MILANVKRFEQWDFNFFCNVILLSSETSADLGYYAEVFQRSDDQDPVKSFTGGYFMFVVPATIVVKGNVFSFCPGGRYLWSQVHSSGVGILGVGKGGQVSWQLGIPGGSYPVGRYPRGRYTYPLQIPPLPLVLTPSGGHQNRWSQVWLASGWYASYWNAFLFLFVILFFISSWCVTFSTLQISFKSWR